MAKSSELKQLLTVDSSNFSLSKVKELFNTYGAVYLTDFLPKEEVQKMSSDISDLIHLQLKESNPNFFPKSNFNFLVEGLNELAAIDRKKVGAVYDAAMKLLSVRSTGVHNKVQELMQFILGSKLLAMSNNIIVRIDRKGEEERLFGWHQDYPYSMVSEHGAVLWSPLIPVSNDMGPVQVIPFSHKHGIRKLSIDERGKLNIQDNEFLASLPEPISFECKPTDIILFDILTLHRSSKNITDAPRWSVTYRYCDMNDRSSLKKGWPTYYKQGTHFKDVYPEYIVKT